MHRQIEYCNRIIEEWVQKKLFQKDLIPERHLPQKWGVYMRKEKETKPK